jgi:hypothetical protein
MDIRRNILRYKSLSSDKPNEITLKDVLWAVTGWFAENIEVLLGRTGRKDTPPKGIRKVGHKVRGFFQYFSRRPIILVVLGVLIVISVVIGLIFGKENKND